MAMVLGTGFLLLISMVLSAALSAVSGVMNDAFGLPPAVAQVLHLTVSLIVITLLFAMIFKVLPDAAVKWNDVWIGGLFTALLFTFGKFLLGFYLGRESTASSYGAAGSLVVVLMWVYYSSIILFFGAEFTQVFAKEHGSRIVPTPNALPATEEARAEEGIPHTVPPPSGKRSKPRRPETRPALALATETASAHKAAATVLAQTPADNAWKHLPNGAEIIQRKPWPFLSAAVALGLLTGWVFKGEWRRKAHS
jgi:membrane protein